jgi:TonB family protein
LLFPLITIHFRIPGENQTVAFLLETITITPEALDETVTAHLGIISVVAIVYLTGATLFLTRFLFQLGQVFRLIRKFGIRKEQGLRLVFTDRSYQPFSFFRLVFIPDHLRDAETLPQIIEHERVHVRQVHSFDLILLEILTIIQWFNPVIWLYRRSLKSVHEYLADEGVIHRGYDRQFYQELLLNQGFGTQVNDLANNFNHSLLKNRIMMMTKQRSGHFSRWKAALALPVAMGLLVVFTGQVSSSLAQEEPKKPQTAEKPAPPAPPPAAGEEVFIQVHKAPEFKGGHEGLATYMVSNVKYPEAAKKNGVQGTVYVSFVVEKDGRVTNQSVLKGASADLDAEALRVIQEMPAWKPGYNEEGKPVRVQMNLPVKFKLDDKVKTEEKK